MTYGLLDKDLRKIETRWRCSALIIELDFDIARFYGYSKIICQIMHAINNNIVKFITAQ